MTATAASFDCQSCGACCATSEEWPRFSLESDAALARIPAAIIRADGNGMACEGARCLALAGRVGRWTGCAIYNDRPQVCRDCMPGDAECLEARALHGLG